MPVIGRLVAIVAAASLLALAAGSAVTSAQIYPKPVGNCQFIPSTVNPPTGAEVTFFLVWTDEQGNPIPNQASNVSVLSQPGSGAKLTPATFVTGPDGTASIILETGDSPGIVKLSAICGSVETQVQVPVGGPPLPPNTGTAGVPGFAQDALVASIALAAGAATATGAFAVRRRVGMRRLR